MIIEQLLEASRDEIISIRRQLHSNPELSGEEFRTAATIRGILKGYGVTIQDFPIKNSVIGLIEGAKPGKTVMIRADIDALPIVEDTGLAYESMNKGACHACGHDIHTSVVLLVAKVLKQYQEELEGNVRFLFQPSEENAKGSKLMIDNGVLDLIPKTDEVFGIHTSPDMEVGKIGLINGVMSASYDNIHFTIKSHGGHGAYPHKTPDPIVAAGHLITQLQTVVSRVNPVMKPAVFTIGTIHGGSSANIIPTEVRMTGNLRAFDKENREGLIHGIKRIAEGIAISSACDILVEVEEGVPVLKNDHEVTRSFIRKVEPYIGEGNFVTMNEPRSGSDDFSCYLEHLPGCYFRIGTANDEPSTQLGLHHPKITFDEESIFIGASVLLEYLLSKTKEILPN